jgi:phosphate transport system substrate-binding protein
MNFLIQYLLILVASYLGLVAQSVAGEDLRWAGCDITKRAFMAELAIAYEQLYDTGIIMEGGGDLEGFRRISNNSAHIGGACRPKNTSDELEKNARANPIAWDALVVMVHPDNPVNNITLDQIRDLYEGRITNWKQLGGEDQPVELLVRPGKQSGVGRSIRKLIFADYDREFVASKTYPSSDPLEKALESSPNAVGISGVASVHDRNIKALTLEGVDASYENIKDGNYLLHRPLYIIFNDSNPRRQEIKQFLKLAHSARGREIIRKHGVVPYLEASKLVLKEREHWDTKNSPAPSGKHLP